LKSDAVTETARQSRRTQRDSLRPDRLEVAVVVALLVALGPLATDLYLPSLPAIGAHFGRGSAEVQLTLSVFLAGFAISQLLYGPLSDRFGRKPVILAGLGIFLLASVFCALAWSLEVLLIGRFLQALGGCAGPVLGRAVVRDAWGADRAAKVLAYTATAMALAPALGPVIGGFLQEAFGWRAAFWSLVLFAAALTAVILFRLPETNRLKNPDAIAPLAIARNFAVLLGHQSYLGFALTVSLSYSGIFAFISGSAFVLIDTLGLSPQAYGFCFGAAVMGYMVGTFSSGRFGQRLGLAALLATGLSLQLLGTGLGFLLAVAGEISVTAIVLPPAIFFMGCGFMLPNAIAGTLRHYPHMAGSASSLMGFLQMTVAAVLGSLVGHLHDGTAIPMMAAMLFCALANLAFLLGLIRPGLIKDRQRPKPA